ncbi:MAG: alpha-amylase family glycosyl hydrolase, partial [Mycoplasma sp.]
YQPVSYKLTSRQGSKLQFKQMINRCRSRNVRIYADAVINHMTGSGNDVSQDHRNKVGKTCEHWGPKAASAGSSFFTTKGQYTNNTFSGELPGWEFPSVPYTSSDFHCERPLSTLSDPNILNYGWLYGLSDLNTEKDYVRQRIADYLTDWISWGVSGFRIDAGKYVSPNNLSAILKKWKDNLGGGDLPEDFTVYIELLFDEEKDLLFCQEGPYNYGKSFEDNMANNGLSHSDIQKIKIWGSDYPKDFPICGYWAISAERTAIGLDCHDDQSPGSSTRDLGWAGSVYIKEKDAEKHRNFEVNLFRRTDAPWKIKLVLSSYSFMNNGASGFPDGNSDCSKCISEE